MDSDVVDAAAADASSQSQVSFHESEEMYVNDRKPW